jgi:hypothetical protein
MMSINSYTSVSVERETSLIKLRYQLLIPNSTVLFMKLSILTVSDADSTAHHQTFPAPREKPDPKEFGPLTIGLLLIQLLMINHSLEPGISLFKLPNHTKMNINGKLEMVLPPKLGTTF